MAHRFEFGVLSQGESVLRAEFDGRMRAEFHGRMPVADELDAKLEVNPQCLQAEELFVRCPGMVDEPAVFARIGQVLQRRMPNLLHLVVAVNQAGDEPVALLLEHTHNITILELLNVTLDELPLTFAAIGSLDRLEKLVFHPHFWPKLTIRTVKILAKTIQALPVLKDLDFAGWHVSGGNTLAILEPLLNALQNKKTLELVNVPAQARVSAQADAPGSFNYLDIPVEELNAIQTWPRINQVIREFNLPTDWTCREEFHGQWIDAMISVKDEFPFFYFFLRELLPQLADEIAPSVTD